jgi:vacuolar protein sorting-associated protein 35
MILESCNQILRTTPITNTDNNSMKLLVKLLSIPLETLSIAVLNMSNYPALMKYMKFSNRRVVALRIVKAVIKDKKVLDSTATVDQLLDFIMPLLIDDADSEPEESYEFEEGQEQVSKLVNLIHHDSNNDLYYDILMKFKKIFVKGGSKRMKYSIPTMVFALFKLSATITKRMENPPQVVEEIKEESADEPAAPMLKVDQPRIYKTINELILMIKDLYPEITLRLYLQAALALNNVPSGNDLEELGYEFVSQSMIIFQEDISDSDQKLQAIYLIISTVFNLTFFGRDNYDTLATNAVSYCSKLLKKHNQCEAITFASGLFYS